MQPIEVAVKSFLTNKGENDAGYDVNSGIYRSKNKNPWFYQNLTEQNEEERIHQGPIFEQLYKWKLVFLSNLETLAVANNLHYHHHVTPDVPKPLASAILKLASVPVVGTSQEPIQFMIQKLKLLVQIIVTRTALTL